MLFTVLTYYEPALIGVSLLLAACGLLALFNRSQAGLRLLMQEYWELRKKWRLGSLVLAVLLLNCFLVPAKLRYHSSAVITLNYSLASQGLNPNGTRFNQTDILSNQVLQRAIEKGALEGITLQDLKKTLRVQPVVQGDSWSEDGYFISTQFVVRYEASRETAEQDGEKLLTLVTQAYKEWFVQEYSANTSALKLDFTQAEQQDYLDCCSFLSKTAEGLGQYMLNMSSEEPAFRSSVNGETFQSVSAQAYEASSTLVESLEAYVLEEGVSKDVDQYISRLNVANDFLYFDAEKASASNENTLEALSMYENDMARIVLVPTYDTNNQFYMSQTRIGVDDFAASADHYAEQKISIHSEMAGNSHIIEQFSSGRRSAGTDAKAEQLIGQIEQELTRIARQAEELVKEYNAQQANQYMTASVASGESQAKRLAVKIAALTLLFAVGLRLCWFAFAQGWRRERAA